MEFEAVLTLVLDESEDPKQQAPALVRFTQAVQDRSGQIVEWVSSGRVMMVPVNVRVSDDLSPAIQVWSATTRALTIFEGAYISSEIPQWEVAGIQVLTEAEAHRRSERTIEEAAQQLQTTTP